MNIPKAIEILKLTHDTPPSGAIPDFLDAIELGIEAMKMLKEKRAFFGDRPEFTLPGETKD